VLALLARVMPIDAFAVNVVTILGLGAAIDYALFLVTRYREELAAIGRADAAARLCALERTLATAGRSVLFAGITVVTSLAGLLVFGVPFLRSVALGGIAVVLMAATLALVLLPALLALFGQKLERGRLPWRRHGSTSTGGARWRRLGRAVLAHRVVVCAGVALSLLALATPFLRLRPSRSDVRALPPSTEPRRAFDALARDFPAVSLTPMNVIVTLPDDVSDADQLGELYDYEQRLRALPSVMRIESLLQFADVHDREAARQLSPAVEGVIAEGTSARARGLASIVKGRRTLIRVITSAPPDSQVGQQLVTDVRALAPPPGATVLVYGQAASLHDFAHGLARRVPFMMLTVGLAMFAVLYAAFRSLLLPLKAMIMTALSLTASFGALVFVFQDGRLQGLLHYHALGTIDAALPVVMFAIVFGLSMDYEVIILTRIREAWLRTGDNDGAIVEGVAQTGGVITGAAAVMIVVFSAFAMAGLLFVKAIGVGTALAVALDATVVRLLLVPATMSLLGRLNWWSPLRSVPR
jgi:RND superfamily putative drug exporter